MKQRDLLTIQFETDYDGAAIHGSYLEPWRRATEDPHVTPARPVPLPTRSDPVWRCPSCSAQWQGFLPMHRCFA